VLRTEPFDQLVAARLLDFFGAETAWQRRLWDVGTCLTLREIVEAADAVAERALSSEALDWLKGSALAVAGPDIGVGTAAERSTLTTALKGNVAQGSFDLRIIENLAESASRDYLDRWASALDAGAAPVGPERLARAIGGHLLGLGFSPDYLHRWLSYRVRHEDGTRSLADLLRDAHDRVAEPLAEHDVIIPLRRATARVHEVVGWLPPDTASDLLTPINKNPIAALAGAIHLTITAHDPGAAVEIAADLIDRYVARITLGGGGEGLDALPYVWVTAGGPHKRMRLRRRRGLEIPVLLRRTEPITSPVAPRIDSSLELLGPVDQGPTTSAVAGGWAAVETLLSAPGDRAKVHAADRLAALIACSFPRAELTQLAHRFVERDGESNPELAQALASAATNTAGAGRLARHLKTADIAFSDESDAAATRRIRAIVLSPHSGLRDLETHLQRSLRRLYRVRNLVLHNAATDSLTLAPALRAAAPLLGAGIDRLVRGALLQGVEPLDLAAKARIAIDNADHLGPGDLADLLQLADP
jgi:hypothetical protein